MLIDFEKAFDSLSFSFIEKTLTFFRFGDMFKKWIQLFLYDTDVSVQLNGFLSEFFRVQRGCRQGDPISSYIFILCAEILAIKIRNSKDVTGIKIKDSEYLISQFADDTSLLLDGSEKSLKCVLEILSNFALISGLKVNFDKTKVIWIGCLKYSTRSIKTRWKLVWGETRFKLLGINFDVNLENMFNINFNSKLVKVTNSISHWKRRKLTPIGRITVVKTLLVPIFTHLFVSLPSPPQYFVKKLSDMFSDFVWNGKPKIKTTIFVKNYNEGGLKMIDIPSYINSLKIKWIKNAIKNSNSKCYQLVNDLFDMNKVMNCGKMYCEKIVKNIKNNFWIDVLKSYIKYIEKFQITELGQILNMPLFYNEHFLVNKKPIYNKTLYDKGIRFVKDILQNNGCFVSFNYLKNVTGINDYLQYYAMKDVVSCFFKKKKFKVNQEVHVYYHNPSINCYMHPILTNNNVNRYMYKVFIENNEIPTSKNKWMSIFDNCIINWKNTYSYVFKYTKDTYLQWMQTRIIHRILPTNMLLYKMKITDNKLCTFCRCQEETLMHLFCECCKVKPIVDIIKDRIRIYNSSIDIEDMHIILGYCKDINIDTIFLEFKRYVFLCKTKTVTPSVTFFKRSLKLAWDINLKYSDNIEESKKWSIVREFV